MKKQIAIALALLTFSASLALPRRSEAALGLFSGNVPLLVTGAVFASLDTPVFLTCTATPWGHTCRVGLYAGLLGALGLILLDNSQDQNLLFGELTTNAAGKLGVTSAQAEAYNHELAEINAIRETIQGEVLIRAQKGEKVVESQIHRMWQDYRSMLSPGAFAALEKVSEQSAKAAALQ